MPLSVGQGEARALQGTPASRLPHRLAELLVSTHSRIIDLFRLLDRNLDGAVTKQELATALDSLRIECTTDELDELFDYLDPNGDGVIVFRELQQAIYAAQRGGRPSQAVPSHAKRSRPQMDCSCEINK